jgi:hypothetical protein
MRYVDEARGMSAAAFIGSRGIVNNPEEFKKLEFRVALLERAMTGASMQIRELTAALATFVRHSPKDHRPPAPVAVDPDSVAPFSAGFYRREEDNTGRSFRWTGRGDHFEFRLGIDRNVQWAFAIELRPNPHVPAAKLRAFVDYAEIPIEVDAVGRFVRGAIPVREFGSLVTLTFFLPNTFQPSGLDPKSKDSRTLGLAFYSLKLEPAAAEQFDKINGAEMPGVVVPEQPNA